MAARKIPSLPRIHSVPFHGQIVRRCGLGEDPPASSPSMDLSLENPSDSQVLGLSSLPPSPPSEPPDIRNWFPSYEYDTPEPSGLSFGIGSHAGDSERTALSGEIQVLPPRDHGSNLQSRRPLERNRTPDLECIPIREAEDERRIRGRNDLNHIQDGASSPDCSLMDEDQISPDGSGWMSKSGIGDDDREPALSQMIGIPTKHHEESRKIILSDSSCSHEHLIRSLPGGADHLLNGTADSMSICGIFTRKELFLGRKFTEEGKCGIAGCLMPSRGEDSPKMAGGIPNCWISTRKNRRSLAEDERLLRKDLILKDRKNEQGNMQLPSTSRAPLTEKTDLPYGPSEQPREADIPGKWRCPRKNKADRGPPMKQLRLECWVRRVI